MEPTHPCWRQNTSSLRFYTYSGCHMYKEPKRDHKSARKDCVDSKLIALELVQMTTWGNPAQGPRSYSPASLAAPRIGHLCNVWISGSDEIKEAGA